MTTFVVLISKTYILGHLITLYCPCTLCARNIACTERARAMVGTQTPIHICFRSQHYECSHLALFWKRLETIFEKKIIFSPKGPPFGFRVICPLVFGLREGFIFKLESSGFHQTSSFCDLHPHVNAKNPTPKF